MQTFYHLLVGKDGTGIKIWTHYLVVFSFFFFLFGIPLCFVLCLCLTKMCDKLCTFEQNIWNTVFLFNAGWLCKLIDKYRITHRILSSCIYYVVAKIGNFVLKDVDMLPLQGLTWQSDQVNMLLLLLLQIILHMM